MADVRTRMHGFWGRRQDPPGIHPGNLDAMTRAERTTLRSRSQRVTAGDAESAVITEQPRACLDVFHQG